jgi:hypothetical protein
MMEMEKKPKAVKKTKRTTNQPGVVESIDAKKTSTKKKSTVTESVNGAGPQQMAPRKKEVAATDTNEPKVTQMRASHEEIARLAHRYWAERGGQHGSHVDDWLRAERELRGKAS